MTLATPPSKTATSLYPESAKSRNNYQDDEETEGSVAEALAAEKLDLE
jgi:hypothetical protein